MLSPPPIRVGRVERRLRANLGTLLLRDQLLFAMGIVWLMVGTGWLVRSPGTFPWVHLLGLPPVFAWLCYSFIRRHRFWGFFLLDYCYAANALAWCFFLSALTGALPPFGPRALPCLFALCTGPLLLANLPWRVSLTFHSPDKMCSVFVHTCAPLAFYAYRWHTPAGLAATAPGGGASALLGTPLLVYGAWQAAYLLVTEACCFARLLRSEPRLVTSLRWQVASFNRALLVGRSGLLHDVASAVGATDGEGRLDAAAWPTKAFFVGSQLAYTLAGLLCAAAAWRWHSVHATLLAGVGLHVIFQGAGFYVNVFSTRYISEARSAVAEVARGGAGGEGGAPPPLQAVDGDSSTGASLSQKLSPSRAAALAALGADALDGELLDADDSGAWSAPRQRKLSRASQQSD
jgi:hypothetical protein